jgi:hypothetical protein
VRNDGYDEVLENLRRLNPYFIVFAPKIQPGFTTRLKSEQANVRKLVIRMDTMRRTSYVSAGYLIAEVTGLMILVLLLITQIGQLAPTLLVVGVITYLLVYAVAMIRDIDNPFEYPNGRAGAADVDLGVLESCETGCADSPRRWAANRWLQKRAEQAARSACEKSRSAGLS